MLPSPTDSLGRTLPRRATVALRDGRTVAGRPIGVDEHMNLVVDDTVETGADGARRLGRAVVRGSAIATVVADDGPSERSGTG